MEVTVDLTVYLKSGQTVNCGAWTAPEEELMGAVESLLKGGSDAYQWGKAAVIKDQVSAVSWVVVE